MKLHLDIETFSECDIKVHGSYRYAEHPSTALVSACYAIDESPIHIWLPFDVWDIPQAVVDGIQARPEYDGGRIDISSTVPKHLVAAVKAGQLRAHKADFERTVLNGVAGKKVGFPYITIESTVCTMAKCRANGLPAGLEDAADALGTHPKMATGRANMLSFCKPRSGEVKRYLPWTDIDRYVQLVAYNIDDVKAERGVDHKLPDLSPSEQQVYQMDQRMNDRGVAADLISVGHAQALVNEYRSQLEGRCIDMTKSLIHPEGLKPTQREKVSDWIRTTGGYPQLSDMQADTVAKLTRREDVPQRAKDMLKLYGTYGMKAVAKLDTIEDMVCADGRLHGLFTYHGAGPGRWSSSGVQLQNMMRPVFKNANTAIDLFSKRNLDALREAYPDVDPMKVIASTMRGMLVVDAGKDLLAIDYAGIESRITAWVCGEDWALDAFRLQDKKLGPDNYRIAYADAFQVPVESVTDWQRQIGKPIDLSMCFEGGIGALVTMAASYNVDLAELTRMAWGKLPQRAMESAEWMLAKGYLAGHDLPEKTLLVCDAIKWAWRARHTATVAGWKQLKDAACEAVRHPGTVYTVDSQLVMFKVEGDWLCLRLPSGRRIKYYRPIVKGEGKDSELSYEGSNNDQGGRWMRTHTYGGKLMQNIAEGIGRDLLVHGMRGLEPKTGPLVMCVHDEAVGEIPMGSMTLDEAMKIFVSAPKWAEGLPLAAEGWIGKRYRK